MLDELFVYSGGFKGNSDLNAIDIYNTSSKTWAHANMSVGRTLFDGAALGPIAIFGCGEGDGAGTADILDVRSNTVTTVQLGGGSRKKCAATSIVLATDAAGNPTDGKILIGGGYKSVAVDIWDLKTNTWSVTNMSTSHFYMAAASAGSYALFCGGLAPSGDTALCDVYDARTGNWSVGNLSKPVREISAASVGSMSTAGCSGSTKSTNAVNVPELAVFLGGGQTTVFNATASPPTWTYGNSTPHRSPWSKFGRASVSGRWAIFAGGNGNTNSIEIYDGLTAEWSFAKHNLSFGREQVMGAGAAGQVGFAGGSIGAYKPTGYTARVDMFKLSDLLQ
jgi:hypothetical protein